MLTFVDTTSHSLLFLFSNKYISERKKEDKVLLKYDFGK